MVSLIKNQIIKHLSIFAKNLKPEQISLEVLGGTGELRNIELNEAVLSEKLELPPFLRIRRADCNRVKVKVPWTKLNSAPVEIIVDELRVTLELGSHSSSDSPRKSSSPSSYGFADRVVEGLSIKINVLDISFESASFSGSLWLSPLTVESVSPAWNPVTSLKRSRISDSTCHQVIFFKQITWNLLKIQAFAHSEGGSDRGQRLNSPLRLITQGGKCRIAIKKDSNDGSLLAGRIQTIFEDIHWVATLAEVRSAISFYKHIVALAKASGQETSAENPFLVDYSAKSRSQRISLPNPAIKSTIFKQFDVGQTSHHVYINKVHMTLIDDHTNSNDYPENWNLSSGAMQVSLERISVDFYLQNLITDDRRYWVRYETPNEFTVFAAAELDRHLENLSVGLDTTARERLKRLWSTLTSQSLVIRIEDVVVECVSEQSTKREDIQDFYTSKTATRFSIPTHVPAIHFEFSNYFFPGSTTPEPPVGLAHGVVGPSVVLVDNRTIRWMMYVIDNITRSLDIEENAGDPPVVCARIDILMPRIVIPCPFPAEDDSYPQKFVANVSTVTISNRALDRNTFSIVDLFKRLTDENLKFISTVEPPGKHELRHHVAQTKQLAAELAANGASTDILPTRWYFATSPLWMDAVPPVPNTTAKVYSGATVLSDVMLAGCIDVKLPNLYIALEPLNSLGIVIDHYQFIQLMRVQKSISDLVEQLELDKNFFSNISAAPLSDSPLSLYCFCEEINVHLVLPVGLAPSPYEIGGMISKSDTATTLSSEVVIDKNDETISQVQSLTTVSTNPFTPNTSSTASPMPPPAIREPAYVDFNAFNDDRASNYDDMMSMVSDDDSSSQAPFDGVQLGDDIFPELAEEAIEVDEIQLTKLQMKRLERNVNALSATLNNFNVTVCTEKGESKVTGYASTLKVKEVLNVPLKIIFDKNRTPSTMMADKSSEADLTQVHVEHPGFRDAQLQFKVNARGSGDEKYAHVIAKLRELDISLDDEVVSYLGAFIRDDTTTEDPLFLELSIEKSNIAIKNQKRQNPLRIHVGELSIIDGEKKE